MTQFDADAEVLVLLSRESRPPLGVRVSGVLWLLVLDDLCRWLVRVN